MKRILVPTDFSSCAEAAGEVACALAARMDALVYFLHIYSDPGGSRHVPSRKATNDSVPGAVRNALNQEVLKAESVGLKANPVLVLDRGNEKIEDYIKSFQIDLVVMGSHGVKGIREWMIGSNTERVIKRAEVPVLVIKKAPPVITFSKIVFASAFESDVRGSLRTVVEFSQPWQATINLLYINMVSRMIKTEEARAAMQTVAAQFPGVTFTFNVSETNDAEWAISQFAHDLQADLIAISSHDTTPSFKILEQNVTRSLTHHEELPVMVINDGYAFTNRFHE